MRGDPLAEQSLEGEVRNGKRINVKKKELSGRSHGSS